LALFSVKLKITGRVQGVGYRYYAERVANSMGVTGYVKNLSDGSVEVYAEGEESVLKNFINSLKKGPPLSAVSNIKEDWNQIGSHQFGGFYIKY